MKCQEKNISVAYMLRECGLSATMIYEMEKRDKSPRLDNILKISDFLDCSVDYLTGRTDNPDSHKL
ncbi:MAG: helix-turn-helix transcriptional regulator [Ruminococcus sp.]|nr:helix-turn-helix transcriptional regulator [Ruminococcus sp.]